MARHPRLCAPLLYQPRKRRVRGCGEVLSSLPVPGTTAARAWGPMHELPKLTPRNWKRLQMIPAGGNWRSLEQPDLAVSRAFDAGYAVLKWSQPARTIAASSAVGCGAYSVADPRVDQRSASDEHFTIASDGTWHRPLTFLELAALQGSPVIVNGEPLCLAGSRSAWRERIGNAVPPPAAEAIARQMLASLSAASLGTFPLSSDEVWVSPNFQAHH